MLYRAKLQLLDELRVENLVKINFENNEKLFFYAILYTLNFRNSPN